MVGSSGRPPGGRRALRPRVSTDGHAPRVKAVSPGWSRRSLLVPAALVLAGGAAALAWRLISPPPSRGFAGLVRAGQPQEYAIGDVKSWAAGRFYMVRGSSGFVALYRQCPHLRCTIPPPVDGVFECRCHLSRFGLTGELLRGPAKRPMDRLPIRLVNGELVVTTGEAVVTRRTSYSDADAFDPGPVA